MKDCRPKIDELRIDELLIDELVSGQLSGERYRAALRALDAEPAKWRDCALAFLEEQALRSELRALAQGTIDWADAKNDCSEGETASVSSVDNVVLKPPPSPELKLKSSQSQSDWSGFKTILSTAALLMISFTVGWLGSETLAEYQRTAIDTTLSSIPNIAKPASELRPQIEPQFVVDEPGAFDRGIRQLERNGRISVKTYDMIVPTILDDGSSVIVPVHEMILSPSITTY